MCGIAGILKPSNQQSIDDALLKTMNDAQFHRGPDQDGYFIDGGVGLAHRRLSIIDLSSGRQPIFNEDGSVAIVFNGEIYNYRELAQSLKQRGHEFKTHSDTETIVHAWEEWGPDCVHRLRGMFAFAIWDGPKRQLFLARDRLGIKPVHYSVLNDGTLIFGSELKVLMQHPQLDRSFDPYAIENYFSVGYVPEPRSIYKNVQKLQPGHSLLVKQGEAHLASPKQYWDIANAVETVAQYSEQSLFERISEAVQVRMVSEVPIGAFLSGGVDSSTVVACMARLQDDPVNTCSIGFDVPGFNETDFAKLVADRYHTNHWLRQVKVDDFELIPKIGELYDEPYADSSALPTYRVCQLARENVTVALSGDGADEIFAGYDRYELYLKEQRIRNALPYGLRKGLFSLLGNIYPKLDWAPRFLRAKSMFMLMSFDDVAGYHDVMSIWRPYEANRLYSSDFKSELNGYRTVELFRDHADRSGLKNDPLKLAQYLDLKTYLPGDILTKVDRASMAHSLEVRAPLIDHRLAEWSFGIPSSLNMQNGEGKAFLKKSVEPYVPYDVLYRKKMGFGVPIESWFRNQLVGELRQRLLSKNMKECGLFNMDYIETMLEKHVKGVRDASSPLWTLLMFEQFLERNTA